VEEKVANRCPRTPPRAGYPSLLSPFFPSVVCSLTLLLRKLRLKA
jgi:hypothetical protein